MTPKDKKVREFSPVAKHLRRKRVRSGLSLNQVARKGRTTASAIHYTETCQRVPSVPVLRRHVKGLGYPDLASFCEEVGL